MCFRLSSSSSKLRPQGSFDEKVCKSLHSINPYGSREGRIVFSTWNLDHRFTPPLVYLQDFLEFFFFFFALPPFMQFFNLFPGLKRRGQLFPLCWKLCKITGALTSTSTTSTNSCSRGKTWSWSTSSATKKDLTTCSVTPRRSIIMPPRI